MRSECLHCGREIDAPASRRACGRGRFCSRQCAGHFSVGTLARRFTHGNYARCEHRCARCDRKFEAKAESRFCSLACAKRPKAIFACKQCGRAFHPKSLKVKYCSWECAIEGKRVEIRKPPPQATQEARRAQRRVAYLVKIGTLMRPTTCEQCGCEGDIEAAHFDYAEPERVRWLCRYCHRVWDRACPKNGTVRHVTDAEQTPATEGFGVHG